MPLHLAFLRGSQVLLRRNSVTAVMMASKDSCLMIQWSSIAGKAKGFTILFYKGRAFLPLRWQKNLVFVFKLSFFVECRRDESIDACHNSVSSCRCEAWISFWPELKSGNKGQGQSLLYWTITSCTLTHEKLFAACVPVWPPLLKAFRTLLTLSIIVNVNT